MTATIKCTFVFKKEFTDIDGETFPEDTAKFMIEENTCIDNLIVDLFATMEEQDSSGPCSCMCSFEGFEPEAEMIKYE